MTQSIPLDTGHLRVGYIKDNFLVLDAFKPYFYNDFPEFIIPAKQSMNNKQKSFKNGSYKMIQNNKEFQIDFWDLSRNVRLNLHKEFTIKLFDERILNNKILELLAIKEHASTAEIADHLKKSKNKILKKLKLLSDKNKVAIEGKVASNRSYVWRLSGGETNIE